MKFILKSADIWQTDGASTVHRHKHAELFVSLEGRATEIVNGVESNTGPLEVFVLGDDVSHAKAVSAHYRYCIFKFDMELLERAVSERVRTSEGFQYLFMIDPGLRREGEHRSNLSIDLELAEFAELTAGIIISEGEGELSDRLFVSLVELISLRAGTLRQGSDSASLIRDSVYYMNTHFADDVRVSELAARSGYSERHFSRTFKRMMGVSPNEYLSELRLQRAAAMLCEGSLSVTEIAERVGISDNSLLCKAFRRRFGMTPTEYRRQRE
ncbi:MAG: helix-turn-helix transcriptional regulator [Clostridia bacterium]|nr:helix-turn-helix transcriptional regulator [Clostridia bacterium]